MVGWLGALGCMTVRAGDRDVFPLFEKLTATCYIHEMMLRAATCVLLMVGLAVGGEKPEKERFLGPIAIAASKDGKRLFAVCVDRDSGTVQFPADGVERVVRQVVDHLAVHFARFDIPPAQFLRSPNLPLDIGGRLIGKACQIHSSFPA